MVRQSMEQWKLHLNEWAKKMPRTVQKALLKAAEIVRGEALYSHLSGPKMAKGVGSATRGTLARQSGDLAGSLKVRSVIKGKKIRGTVGANMVYAAIHEFGMKSRGMPERSYLRSSLRAKQKAIMDTILKGMLESYKIG